jgi:adenylate kinase
MRLVLLGPPGAGKGTQATHVSARLGVPAISTGDIFRANVSQGTGLGREAQRYMDAGEYVPDSVTNAMVRDRLAQPDCKPGFLLDGYPRTPAQVAELDGMLAERGEELDVVVQLVVDKHVVLQRLMGRGALEGRSDDTEAVIENRLDVFEKQTAPLADMYAARGILRSVDGLGPVDEVTERIMAVLPDGERVHEVAPVPEA